MAQRTTVRLDPHLLAEVKKLAASTHRTLTSVLEEALRETLARRRRRGRTVPALTIVDGRGVRAGIDLDDSAALLDAMEDRRGPA
jgi:hypothetical protein